METSQLAHERAASHHSVGARPSRNRLPLFHPRQKGSAILSDLVSDRVDVSVLTNSLAATDVAAVHGAYANYRKRLLRNGVKLFELQPFSRQPSISVFGSKGASLHTKAFTVDDKIGFVGSFNFDPRSVSLNSEMGVLFEDEHLVAELQHRFQTEISPETSYRLELKGNVLHWHGCDEGQTARLYPRTRSRIFSPYPGRLGPPPSDRVSALAGVRRQIFCFQPFAKRVGALRRTRRQQQSRSCEF